MRQGTPGDGFHVPAKEIERAVFKRARSDGVKAVFLVPTAHTAGYWKGLRARAVAQLELTSPKAVFHNPQGTMGIYTLLLVEFGGAGSSSEASCGQGRLHRGRRQRLSALELGERSPKRAELAVFDSAEASGEQGYPASASPNRAQESTRTGRTIGSH